VALLAEFIDHVLMVLFQYFRFYSHDSSFVHGGIEKPGEELPPVMGQAVSHHRILTMHNIYSFY